MKTQATPLTDIQPNAQKLLKKCPFCSEAIFAEAKKCRYCGELLDPKLKKSATDSSQQKWSPAIAAALSLLVPGGGHIYRGKVMKGFLWILLVAAGYSLYILPGIILHLVCIAFASSGNPMEE